jgi:hypothetical protein
LADLRALLERGSRSDAEVVLLPEPNDLDGSDIMRLDDVVARLGSAPCRERLEYEVRAREGAVRLDPRLEARGRRLGTVQGHRHEGAPP